MDNIERKLWSEIYAVEYKHLRERKDHNFEEGFARHSSATKAYAALKQFREICENDSIEKGQRQ